MLQQLLSALRHTYTHNHIHIYIYIYIHVFNKYISTQQPNLHPVCLSAVTSPAIEISIVQVAPKRNTFDEFWPLAS